MAEFSICWEECVDQWTDVCEYVGTEVYCYEELRTYCSIVCG